MRRLLRAKNFAPEACSCWPACWPILGPCWPSGRRFYNRTNETPPSCTRLLLTLLLCSVTCAIPTMKMSKRGVLEKVGCVASRSMTECVPVLSSPVTQFGCMDEWLSYSAHEMTLDACLASFGSSTQKHVCVVFWWIEGSHATESGVLVPGQRLVVCRTTRVVITDNLI